MSHWIAHPNTGNVGTDWDSRYEQSMSISVAGHGAFDNNPDLFWAEGKLYIAKLVQAGIPTAGMDVAEYGCGPGRILAHIPSPKKLTGYDVSNVAMDIGRDKLQHVSFVQVDAMIPDVAQHDVIYSHLVMQHNPKSTAIRLAKLLISRSRVACIIDFPKIIDEQKPIDDGDSWTGRTYAIEELRAHFPESRIVDLGEEDRWFVITEKKGENR